MDSSNLLKAKNGKLSEMLAKEAEKDRLEGELAVLQDKKHQAGLIEESLKAKYAKLREKYPIDRSQEGRIDATVKEKNDAVSTLIGTYNGEIRYAKSRHTSGKSKLKDPSYRYYWDEKERKKDEREYKSQLKVLDKQYNDDCKEASKTFLDGMKRVFGELEIDLKLFYKNGISRENIERMVSVMERIYTQGTNVGTIPLSYQQKIYKWQQTAKDMPEDIEKIDREQEEVAESAMRKELKTAEDNLTEAKKDISRIEKEQITRAKEIERLRKSLATAEKQYPSEKEKIEKDLEKKKQALQNEEQETENELKEQCEARKAELQKAQEDLRKAVEGLVSETEQLKGEKSQKEEELNRTFLLSFGKKKMLRERVAEIEQSVGQLETQIADRKRELEEFSAKDPDGDLKEAIKNEKKELKKKIVAEEMAAKDKIRDLDSKKTSLANQIKNNTSDAATADDKLDKLRRSTVTLEKKIRSLSDDLKSFHENYLINMYGKELDLKSQIDQKKKELKEANAGYSAVKKEVASLEKELKKAEKEEAQRQEEARRIKVEKAQEEIRLKEEREERRKRIQKELREREKEQSVIGEKTDLSSEIATLIKEFEKDKDHPMLQDDIWPLKDNGSRVITNSIVRKRYTQNKETPDCSQYLLVFADRNGNTISEQRLIAQKTIGEETATSFELKAADGFNKGNYYLLMLNFNSREVICAQRYRINISFSNDFDF